MTADDFSFERFEREGVFKLTPREAGPGVWFVLPGSLFRDDEGIEHAAFIHYRYCFTESHCHSEKRA